MSDLSPETRALLERARGGEALPAAHRTVLRRRLAGALGLAGPFGLVATAAASVRVATWAVRGLAVVGTAGVVSMAVLAPAAAPSTHGATSSTHAATVDRIAERPVAGHAVAGHAGPSGPIVEPVTTTARPPAPPDSSPSDPGVPPPPEAPSETPRSDPGVPPLPMFRAPERTTPRPAPFFEVNAPAGESPRTSAAVEAPPESDAVTTGAPRSAPVEDPLAEEVRLVGDARNAIESGDAARALAVLAEHARRFANGALGPEAAALRVEALCAAGRAADAEVDARHFEATYPGSPLVRRFASTCARDAARDAAPAIER